MDGQFDHDVALTHTDGEQLPPIFVGEHPNVWVCAFLCLHGLDFVTELIHTDGRVDVRIDYDDGVAVAPVIQDGVFASLDLEFTDQDGLPLPDREEAFAEYLCHDLPSGLDQDEALSHLGEIHAPLLQFIAQLLSAGLRVSVTVLERDFGATQITASREGQPWATGVWCRDTGGDWDFDPAVTGRIEDGKLTESTAEDVAFDALLDAPGWVFRPGFDADARWHSSTDVHDGATALRPFPKPAPPTSAEIAARLTAIDTWARARDFTQRLPHPTKKTVRDHLAEQTGNGVAAGLYVLEFADGACYVGQSKDLANRFGTHASTYDDIIAVRLQPNTEATALDNPGPYLTERERPMIHSVQDAQLHARNKAEMAVVLGGERQFDKLIDADTRTIWRADRLTTNRADLAADRRPEVVALAEAGARAYSTMVSTLTTQERSEIEEAVADYLLRCMPLPLATELRFWTISCMPTGPRGAKGERSDVLCCLSIGMTEVLTVLRRRVTKQIWAFIQVNRSELTSGGGLAAEVAVRRRHPGMIERRSGYRDNGGATNTMEVELSQLRRLLDDTDVTRAAASGAFDLMRVRAAPTTRMQTHNVVLAGVALERARGR